MNLKKLSAICVLSLAGIVSANAATITADAARQAANDFLKKNVATKGMFHAPSMADLKLAHAEASSVEGNAYYVFNIQGGGWVIMAGDDRAKQVLAYGNTGNIDMNNLPGNMKAYMNMLKGQIETAQAYKGKTVPVKAPKLRTAVEPLLKTDWSQGEPMNRLDPLNPYGDITSVGCGPLAMAQVLYYWKYPNQVGELPGYPGTGFQWYSSMAGTTFDYSLMLDNYYTHDPETGNPTGYVSFTEEQANEVAKLCRYCGQGCKARYGNAEQTSTGTYSHDQRDAFKLFGYNQNLKLIGKDPDMNCDNTNKYSDEEWAALICSELEAGHPIPYHDLYGGHAWVLDGVDAEGRFHMNWGFNGKFNGWFEMNALIIHPNANTTWDFSEGNNGGNEIVMGVYPYDNYVIPGTGGDVVAHDVNKDGKLSIADVTALIDYLLGGDGSAIDVETANVNGNDGVTIADVTALIDILLSGNE